MEQITKEQCLNLLKEKFPKFIPYWESHIAYWGDNGGMLDQMDPFSDYATDIIKSHNTTEIKKIFDFVELLLCHGDESVQDGIATEFLESLLHQDPDQLKFKTYCQYMGKNALDYCRAWDEFTGVRTEGLWEDEKK